jgi:hypothetical protein
MGTNALTRSEYHYVPRGDLDGGGCVIQARLRRVARELRSLNSRLSQAAELLYRVDVVG